MAALVKVDGYTFAYPAPAGAPGGAHASAAPVLDGVSLEVEEGSFCVLAGPCGCGKTTLLRSLKPELAPVGARRGTVEVLGARILENGVPTGALSVRDSAAGVGYVMQDPGAQIVCDEVWHELAFGLENLGMAQNEMRRRVAEVACFFGIEPWMHAATETLSGGRKQLVNLAGALALRPRLLLLDEPAAQLDPDARRAFLFMLARTNRELGVTVVMATHSPEDVAAYASKIVELGPVGPLGDRAAVERLLEPRRARAAERRTGTPHALEARAACFRYARTDPWVLRGADLQVAAGSVHVLVGGNGSGKTTLLKLLAGLLKPQRGRVANRDASAQAYLPQDPKSLFVCDTVAEELAEWRGRCGYTARDEAAALERCGLAECANRHPYDLSGGQQQKLALAKLLLCDPALLLLDEPTKGLDPASCAEAARILRGLADEGRTVVLVTHDLDFALVVADEVSLLFDGEVACTEPAGEFFARSALWRPSERSRLFGALLADAQAEGGAL